MNLSATTKLIVLLAALFVVFTLRPVTVGPPAIDPDHPFDTARAFERLERILGDETPHPVDSDQNDVVRARLLGEIRALGFTPIVRDDFHCWENRRRLLCARVRNVMFWVGAAGPNAIMLASHYDSVPAGPGAADDGAGVAVSLEVAANLARRDLARPVLVLITDGEEAGLIGASSFVDEDPIAALVGAVVNLEARGVTGPVFMFETSTPNGRDIKVLNSPVISPVSNSLATDVYKVLPNDTDLTRFLTLGADAANYALIDGSSFYHTPGDSLANLNQRSFFHMGASAMAAVDAFLAQADNPPETQQIFTDIAGLFIVAMPQALGLPILLLGALFGLAVFVARGDGARLFAGAFPLVALVFGVGLAVGATMLVAAIRPEAQFAAANPWALRGLQNAAALSGAAGAFLLLARSGAALRLTMASWFWFAIVGAGLSIALPGGAILFVLAVIVFIPAAVLFWFGHERAGQIAAGLGGAVFLIQGVPGSAFTEIALLPENASALSIFPVFCFSFFAPLFCAPNAGDKRVWAPVAGSGAIAVVFFVLAILVPAFSAAAPRGLSIIHSAGAGAGDASFSISGSDALPAEMAALHEFSRGRVHGLGGERHLAPAPDLPELGGGMRVISDDVIGDQRIISLAVTAPGADRVVARLRGDTEKITAIRAMDFQSGEANPISVRCAGRSCRDMTVTLTASADVDELQLKLDAFYYGLNADEARALAAARPDWALPIHMGDARFVSVVFPVIEP